MCRHFGYLMLAIALTCTLAAGQQRPQPHARTAPTPLQPRREPLTDRDVIQMAESGKPEAAILATIRSSRTNFDLSPQACRFLAEAHVSRTILNAMGDGSQPPCASTSEPSKPQTPAAVEQCVAACTAQCQKIAGNSARLSICAKDCVQRCHQNGATVSGNISRSTLLAPAPPAIQGSSNASNSAGMLATSSTAGSQRAPGGAGALPGNRKAGLLGDGSAHAPATVIAPSSGGARVALNPQPLSPRTAAQASAGSPGANVAQASAAVSDYRQPPGNRESSGPQPPAVSTSSSSSTQVTPASGGFVPKMPPMSSNPKRDATPPADMATKEKIKSQLNAQLAAAIPRMARPINTALTTPQGKTPEIQALQRQKVFVDSLRTQSGQMKGARIPAQAPPLLVRNQPSTTSNPMVHAPQPNQICVAPQVRAVNGKTSGVIFTQDPQYNDYIITGCGFGSQPGRVYLSGAVTGGRINLVVKPGQWSDTQIEAMVQPGLTGVLDGWPDLMVRGANGSSAKFSNSRFYAQRKSVLLPSIPREYANLANVKVGDSTHGFGTMYCPGPDQGHLFPCIAFNAGPPLDGITNGHGQFPGPNEVVSNAVDRDGGQMQFDSGEDVYDLSSMGPGFEIDYASAHWYAWSSEVCKQWAGDGSPKKPGDSVGYETQGHYGWYKKTKTKIVVDWGVDHCAWRWLGVFKVDDSYNSGYSLQVYVMGPIGIDPWTGHPVSVARNLGVEQPQRITPLR